MVTFETFRRVALSLPGSSEQPHFKKQSYRLGKKIFATFDEKKNQACLKLSLVDQSVFAAFNSSAIFPVPNQWGKQGWTIFCLDEVREDLFRDALNTAFENLNRK